MPCSPNDRKRRPGESALPPPSATARSIMTRIVERLAVIEQENFPSPLDKWFASRFAEVVALVDRYVATVVGDSEYAVSCRRGCADCCSHWVEDVNSFEAAIIAEHLRANMPLRIPAIVRKSIADCREIERLERLVAARLQEQYSASGAAGLDQVDLLLSVFYQLRRPCPLLSDDGICLVYAVRPLTCRLYVSFSDPLRCNPDYINSSVVPTCLIDLSEASNVILDKLHFRHLRFSGDTGLRSLLVRYLSGDQD